MNYDEIYGVTLDVYCKIHGLTKEDLVNKIQTDINLLKENLNKYVYEVEPTNWELVKNIHTVLTKKEKHLKRIKKWKEESN